MKLERLPLFYSNLNAGRLSVGGSSRSADRGAVPPLRAVTEEEEEEEEDHQLYLIKLNAYLAS